ncbi:hypothetical protein L198_06552 [Cryptococcus wingfieldii CBS 7118]|uniref:Uncharacterized protein n=1 Tax=Cryptococcus wingfieldii CBS 7118 TaxID=1295528 RepID=A0A1E3IJI3_9TREE|nr:hypothetical protein L198_06552 [Cryptococcus wingfieldii CBS 7118]ODN88750.1 hypothetical protein L198_06552 [Cryptococcus wingfieldii CBS 7118]
MPKVDNSALASKPIPRDRFTMSASVLTIPEYKEGQEQPDVEWRSCVSYDTDADSVLPEIPEKFGDLIAVEALASREEKTLETVEWSIVTKSKEEEEEEEE